MLPVTKTVTGVIGTVTKHLQMALTVNVTVIYCDCLS